MESSEYVQLVALLVAVALLGVPLGKYMAAIYQAENTYIPKPVLKFESLFYRLIGVNPASEMTWRQYAGALLAFNFLGLGV